MLFQVYSMISPLYHSEFHHFCRTSPCPPCTGGLHSRNPKATEGSRHRNGCQCFRQPFVGLRRYIDAHDTGFFKKNRHPMKYHTTDVVYRPLRSPDQCWCLHFVFGGLPITTLKLGVAGVSKAPMWFHGCFFEEPGDVFLVPKCSEIFQSSLPVTNPPKWPNGKHGDLFLFRSILY